MAKLAELLRSGFVGEKRINARQGEQIIGQNHVIVVLPTDIYHLLYGEIKALEDCAASLRSFIASVKEVGS